MRGDGFLVDRQVRSLGGCNQRDGFRLARKCSAAHCFLKQTIACANHNARRSFLLEPLALSFLRVEPNGSGSETPYTRAKLNRTASEGCRSPHSKRDKYASDTHLLVGSARLKSNPVQFLKVRNCCPSLVNSDLKGSRSDSPGFLLST